MLSLNGEVKIRYLFVLLMDQLGLLKSIKIMKERYWS